MPDHFYVQIPVKPYVKRYIERRYGLPADFSAYPEIQKEVKRCLKKPQTRFDRQYDTKLCTYTETLEIVISQDYFYRYGWEFSRTDVVEFGKLFETELKKEMRNTVSIYRGIGLKIKESIIRYQERFGMDEEYWAYESIKKEYYRKRPIEDLNFFNEIIDKIDQLFSETLSRKKDNITIKTKYYETVE